MTKNKLKNAVLILLAFVLMFSGAFLGARIATMNTGTQTAETQAATTEQTGNIAIPCFEEIRLQAEQTAQSAYFYNPSGNNCYFTVSLFLDDTELYTSDMIAPSEEITEIELLQPLSAGVYYEGIIRYSCYDLDTMEKLNGADVVTRLEVKQ